MKDNFGNMRGKLEIFKQYENGRQEKVFEDKNAITFRAKALMSRIIGAGLSGASNPVSGSDYDWGSDNHGLRVTGIALGNGGHLIYDNSSKDTGKVSSLSKHGSSPIVLDTTAIGFDLARPAMPLISAGSNTWGYDGIVDQFDPGPTYERVENGNIPWDGTINIRDNNVGVDEPHSTLYSETFRIPLDASEGIRFPSRSEVQFKATLPQTLLNNSSTWGFAQMAANIVSEAGLIVGYCPTEANLVANTGQLYSSNGEAPSAANFTIADWNSPAKKDKAPAAYSPQWGTKPPNTLLPDAWSAATDNTWNMLARKTFPALTKTGSFSFIFLWSLSF